MLDWYSNRGTTVSVRNDMEDGEDGNRAPYAKILGEEGAS